MDSPLKRTTLAEQLADQLELAVSEGAWKARLPGARMLAAQYKIHRDTVEVALALLESRGILAPAEPRRSRRILTNVKRQERSSQSKKRLLVIHSGLEYMDRDDFTLLLGMEDVWKERGGNTVWHKVDYLVQRSPEGRLADLIQKHSADALLIYNSPVAWNVAAIKLLPSYFCGGGRPGMESVSHAAYDSYDQLKKILMRLVEFGHSRILVPTLKQNDAFTQAVEQALKDALPAPPEQGTYQDLCPGCPDVLPDVCYEYWKREFSRVRPTAVVVFSSKFLLSLYSYCLHNHLSIPGQISIVFMGYDRQLEWLNPVPTMMRFPANLAIKHFEQWVNKGLVPIGSKFFDLETMDGKSVAALPKR